MKINSVVNRLKKAGVVVNSVNLTEDFEIEDDEIILGKHGYRINFCPYGNYAILTQVKGRGAKMSVTFFKECTTETAIVADVCKHFFQIEDYSVG
tara:strand:- start:2953 stop:3237 length:285 start_codon:yes stop_codon:yes gene_type:complete